MRVSAGRWGRRIHSAGAVALLILGGCAVPEPEGGREPFSTRDRLATRSEGESPAPQRVLPVDARRGPVERAAVPVPTALRGDAIALLRRAVESPNEQLRANAIEGLEGAPEVLEEVVRVALGDPNRGVRFAAVMTVGRRGLCGLLPLVDPLREDPSASVRAAALFAVDRCTGRAPLGPLAEFVASIDPEVRGNAAMILGEIGNPGAIPLLRQAVRVESRRVTVNRNRMIDLQVAESLVRLGEEQEIDVIRAAVFAPAEQGELAAFACILLGRLKDAAYLPTLAEIARREGRDARPAEVRLAAAMAVAMLDPERAPVEVAMAYAASGMFAVRAQAALSLGWMADPRAVPALERLLRDGNPLVQIAAAASILRQLPTPNGSGPFASGEAGTR